MMKGAEDMAGARKIIIATALFYPLAVLVLMVMVIRDDPWTMFDVTYWVLGFGAMPLVWVFFSFLTARRFGRLPWAWVVFHLVVISLATFGHFWLMVQFAAGV